MKNGMFVRVSGDNIAIAPPFTLSPYEVDEVIQESFLNLHAPIN